MRINIITILSLLTLVLSSCGTDKKHFRLSGQLLNLNQGEFLIYSPDGAMASVDTLRIEGGRFDIKPQCVKEGVAIILTPSGAEIPLFIKPGASLEMEGDLSDLSALKITDTADNKLMNDFRKSSASHGSVLNEVITSLIQEHPSSPVGVYLVRKYLVASAKPNLPLARKLTNIMHKEQEDNISLQALRSMVNEMEKSAVGAMLPSFSLTTIDGRTISNNMLKKGISVISLWATWDYESRQQINRLNDIANDNDGALTVVAVSIDSSADIVKRSLGNNTTPCYHVCDNLMTEGKLPRLLSIQQTMDAVIIIDGRITERSLYGEPLYDKVKELLNKDKK